ncbi:MAG: PorP/SprF family type IX secretion system membrane protein [Saprospiraceae bacterium]|nr:PorP/SprF family type IX secretion system membrane protein [Saprospiraceae bacterium]
MKTRIVKILSCLIFAIIFIKPSPGQDANFSQFYNNPIYYNPAFAGISSGMKIRTQYRKLWPRINSNFSACNLTLDVEEINVSGGLGMIASSGREGQGLIQNTQIGGIYSYRILVIPREFIIQVGFEASCIEKHIDYSSFIFSDQLDPVFGNINETSFQSGGNDKVVYPDFTTGAVARFNLGKRRKGKPRMTNTVGAAFHHITQPNESLLGLNSKLPMKTVVHANSVIPLRYSNNKEILFAPAMIYEHQADMETFTAGLNVVKNPIFMGLWMRNRNYMLSNINYDALVVMLGINTPLSSGSVLRVGYSYDITVSKLRASTAGSHEITVSLELNSFKLFNSSVPSLRQRGKQNNKCFNKF